MTSGPYATIAAAQPSSMRAQSVYTDMPVATAFDPALTVPTVTPEVELTLG
ncbi:hypothetical protein [Nocardia rhamnosiphila]|uniref:Uncharacterized protein n=1 Tax=Nocardia rhamnosiphila TaxID=426716 RepID=A0ABV2WRD1_9NOCA